MDKIKYMQAKIVSIIMLGVTAPGGRKKIV